MSESSQSPHGDLARPPAVSRRRLCAIDAFIDLVLEGNLPPTPKQVAERAGISMATFFRYFENLNDIRLSAAARMVERFPLLEVEQIGQGPLRVRIDRFVVLRVALWEKVNLLARLQRSVVLEDPDAAQMVDDVREVMVNQIRQHFEPELIGLTSARREDAVSIIATLTSVESWEQFRQSYRRSASQTRRAWSNAIYGVLCQEEKA